MPTVRSDMIYAYVFRRTPAGVEFLQLLRAHRPGSLAPGTWQPVAGGIEPQETAVQAAERELAEEVGLRKADTAWLGFWRLDRVHPFYIMAQDTIWLAPSFAAEVAPEWRPALNAEHTDARWAPADRVSEMFMWPDQIASIREILDHLLRPGSLCEPMLRVFTTQERRATAGSVDP